MQPSHSPILLSQKQVVTASESIEAPPSPPPEQLNSLSPNACPGILAQTYSKPLFPLETFVHTPTFFHLHKQKIPKPREPKRDKAAPTWQVM